LSSGFFLSCRLDSYRWDTMNLRLVGLILCLLVLASCDRQHALVVLDPKGAANEIILQATSIAVVFSEPIKQNTRFWLSKRGRETVPPQSKLSGQSNSSILRWRWLSVAGTGWQ
jgi:hypothetical protein